MHHLNRRYSLILEHTPADSVEGKRSRIVMFEHEDGAKCVCDILECRNDFLVIGLFAQNKNDLFFPADRLVIENNANGKAEEIEVPIFETPTGLRNFIGKHIKPY